MADQAAIDAVRHAALWFEQGPDGLAPLVDAIGDAHVVLIGEASHGTDEFYRVRADLTAALIQQKSFNLVAVEADWPDAYRANRLERFILLLNDAVVRSALMSPRLERAIGVVYKPETERGSHYFRARLPDQFDAVIHIDTTNALRPLELWAAHDASDLPETYPTGV